MVVRIVLISTLIAMYICNCNGVTEREIRGAVELGCASMAELSAQFGVGTCCGKCVPEARRLIGSAAAPVERIAVGAD
jgi:bacterioferritin-associated ferredoxin